MPENKNDAKKLKISAFLGALVIFAVSLFLNLIFEVFIPTQKGYSFVCPCCPVVSTDNYEILLEPLVNQMTKLKVILHDKLIQAEKMAISYARGSFLEHAADRFLMHQMDSLTENFFSTLQADAADSVSRVEAVIDKHFGEPGFDNDILNEGSEKLKSLLYEELAEKSGKSVSDLKKIPDLVSQINGIVSQYRQDMSGASAFYREDLNSFASTLKDAVSDVLNARARTYGVAGRLAAQDSVSGAFNFNWGSLSKGESVSDAVEYADKMWGERVRNYDVGTKYTDCGQRFLVNSGNRCVEADCCGKNVYATVSKLLTGVKFKVCTDSELAACEDYEIDENGVCKSCYVQLRVGEIDDIARGVSDDIRSWVNRRFQDGESAVLAEGKKFDSAAASLADHYRAEAAQLLKEIVSGLSGFETAAVWKYRSRINSSSQWTQLSRSDVQQSILSTNHVRIEDEDKVPVLLASESDEWNPSQPVNKKVLDLNIKRYFVARQAEALAKQVEEILKSFDVSKIDDEYSDQAWKDAAHFYYFWIILQNEELKLKSVSAKLMPLLVKTNKQRKPGS